MVKKVFTLQEALKLAAAYADAGQFDSAEIFYRSVLSKAPDNAEALRGFARALAGQGKEKPVNAAPAGDTHVSLRSLASAGRFEEAEAAVRNLLVAAPASFELYDALGIILREQKKYGEALEAYKKCLDIAPGNATASNSLGFVLYLQGKNNEALPYFEAAIASDPGHAAAHFSLAKTLRKLGDPVRAVTAGLKAVQLRSDIPAHHLELAHILKEVGDVNTANSWALNYALPAMQKFAAQGRLSHLADLVSAYYLFLKVRDTEEQYAQFCVPAMELFYNAVKNAQDLLDAAPPILASSQAGKRKVAFFAETISPLAHTRNLFNYSSAVVNRPDLNIQPVLYYGEASGQDVLDQYHEQGIATFKVPTDSAIETPGLWLRQNLRDNGIDTCVILGTISPTFIFMLGLRVAPIQIWWSQKYHGLKLDNIDGYLTLGGFEPTREIQGRVWRCIPGLFGPEITAPLTSDEMAKVAVIRRTYLRDRFTLLAGVIGREEKIDNDEYWDCVATILNKHPEIVFIWSGQSERPTIKSRIEARGLMDRCHYIGWVQTKLYANAVDLYLDSFPFPGGHTLIEAMVAGRPAISLVTDAGRRIGIPIFAEPWLKNDGGEALRRHNFEPIFTGPGGEYLLPFVADTQTYIERALALIENPGFRERWVAASRRFVLEYLTDMNRPAEMLNMHIMDVIRDRERIIKAS